MAILREEDPVARMVMQAALEEAHELAGRRMQNAFARAMNG